MFKQTTIDAIKIEAGKISVEPAAILAVAEVESAGVTEWNVAGEKKPPIRFEGHYFYQRLSGEKLKAAVAQGLAAPKAGQVKNPKSYAARYDLLARAAKIDKAAAYESTSWGLGQVMGAHWKKLGYGTVFALVGAAMESVDGQINVMIQYIIKFGLVDELQEKGWKSFADQYNGPASAKNRYAQKIAEAYARYSAILTAPTADAEKEAVKEDAKGNQTYARIQGDLARLGYDVGKADGVWGKRTEHALAKFQTDKGLVADGKWGPITQEALDKAIEDLHADKGDTALKRSGYTGAIGAATEVIRTTVEQITPIAGTTGSQILHYVVVIALCIGAALAIYGVVQKSKAGK